MATTTKNLGIVSPVPADEWNASTTYQKLNIVSHNNGSYIAKQGSTGIEPGVTTNWQTYWMLLVSATGGGSDVEVVQTTGQSTTAVMSQKAVTDELDGKVDKVTGKGLSTNDFTDAEKTKLAGIETGAEVNEIDTITAGENVTVSKSGKTATISATSGGGTEVVANPVLAGTESDLTGLEVAGTKYKVPTSGSGGGTQLYMHNIHLESNNIDTFITLYSSISQQFTYETLRDYIGEDLICLAGFDRMLPEVVINLYYDSVTNTIRITYIGGQGEMSHRNFPSDDTIYDTVKQL